MPVDNLANNPAHEMNETEEKTWKDDTLDSCSLEGNYDSDNELPLMETTILDIPM